MFHLYNFIDWFLVFKNNEKSTHLCSWIRNVTMWYTSINMSATVASGASVRKWMGRGFHRPTLMMPGEKYQTLWSFSEHYGKQKYRFRDEHRERESISHIFPAFQAGNYLNFPSFFFLTKWPWPALLLVLTWWPQTQTDTTLGYLVRRVKWWLSGEMTGSN